MASLEKSFIKTQLKKHWSIRAQAFRPSVLLFNMIEILCIGLISVGVQGRAHGGQNAPQPNLRFVMLNEMVRSNGVPLSLVLEHGVKPFVAFLNEKLTHTAVFTEPNKNDFLNSYHEVISELETGRADVAILYGHQLAWAIYGKNSSIKPLVVVNRKAGPLQACFVIRKKGNEHINNMGSAIEKLVKNEKLLISVPKFTPSTIRPYQRSIAEQVGREGALWSAVSYSQDSLQDLRNGSRGGKPIFAAIVDREFVKKDPSLRVLERVPFPRSAVVYDPERLQLKLGKEKYMKFINELKAVLVDDANRAQLEKLKVESCVKPTEEYFRRLEGCYDRFPLPSGE